MMKLHHEIGIYSWDCNKGYPTPEHRAAIEQFGVSAYHRKTFALLDEQLELEF